APAPEGTVWRVALAASGTFLVLVGGLTALACAAGELDYLQIVSGLPPLHPNAALGFLFWGVAHLVHATGRERSARGLAATLGLLGAFHLTGSIPEVGTNLDGVDLIVPARTALPSGATPAVGFGFLLAAGALAFVMRRRPAAAIPVALVGVVFVVGGPV